MAGVVGVIWGKREAENFLRDDWTGGIALKWKENFRFWRSGFSSVIACDKREAFAQGSASDEAIHSLRAKGSGLLRSRSQ
jgi:hypothetical protein